MKRSTYVLTLEVENITDLDYLTMVKDIGRVVTRYCGVNNDNVVTDINVTHSKKLKLEELVD